MISNELAYEEWSFFEEPDLDEGLSWCYEQGGSYSEHDSVWSTGCPCCGDDCWNKRVYQEAGILFITALVKQK